MTLHRTLGTAAATLVLLPLGGCGTETGTSSGDRPAAGAGDAAGPTELEQHDGRPCPPALVDPPPGSAERFAWEPAAEGLVLRAGDAAWVCRYEIGKGTPGPDGVGDGPGWERAGRPVAVDPASYDGLELVPAAADRACTMDLGPRWVLVVSDGGDLTGVVVDAFGCRDVRATDDPWTAAPGAGGVLAGPADLLERLVADAG